MREEITEPQHWRFNSQPSDPRNTSWSARRRSQEHAELAAAAVDAALAEEVDPDETSLSHSSVSADIISRLASQLDLLEKQREQLQKLLDQARTIDSHPGFDSKHLSPSRPGAQQTSCLSEKQAPRRDLR